MGEGEEPERAGSDATDGRGLGTIMAIKRQQETFAPVTLGHIGSHGCRDLLVYCISGRCHHSAMLNGDWLSDDTPVRSLCRHMVCTRCGMIGADVRSDWRRHVNKRRV